MGARAIDSSTRTFADEPPTSEVVALDEGEPRPETLAAPDRATLTFIEGPTVGLVVPVAPGGALLIGRGAAAQVRIPETNVSREHARIRWDRAGYVLDAMGPTWVDGVPVAGTTQLQPGARVQLGGSVRLRFDLHDEREQRVLLDLHEAAMRDPLTGAYTQRYLRERLHAELSYASRHHAPVGLLMIDLDHFKSVNDRYGHPAGDEVLRETVAELKRLLRPEDVLVRYGGEELCVLLRGLGGQSSFALAERLRRAVRSLRIASEEHVIRVTVSIGVAAMEPGVDSPGVAALVRRADRALYKAKQEGRDRCVLDANGPPSQPPVQPPAA
jgi:diguanylate cyclase (GGDEF)-like protein